ncbi:ATP-binding protein [Puerhibacterium puerhi]|uniref:ATP-binding protein n=1 Tax=Puerhibacterium puerhi TaxID=2692623 RepID=UPI00135C05FF|nr:SbcC/MukB-like Walker B domain-containing protein [Puerhibacterium puerhi]
MADSLFGLIPAASTGQQWVARDLQLVNWGGYSGWHQVRFAATATLLSGASGSGKSTLLDAYIALLMPHTTPFNGASNGGVVGRPRGKDQRNVISYSRGKIDESRTAEGTRETVLRGDGTDTWSAIAMTWADQAGSLFTALRAWYVPADATRTEDLVAVRASVDGAFDARDLEPVAARRLARGALAELGLTLHDTDRDFTARLHATLGIGAAGGGAKAVALLGRIQAGQQITTVDALYKSMVLEEPETLAVADAAVAHFDDLAGTRTRMLVAKDQVRVLAPIRRHRAAVDAARERLAVIGEVGTFDDAASPASLWRHERRLGLLRAAEADVRRRARDAKADVASRQAAHEGQAAALDGLRQALWAAGGERAATAEREIAAARARVADVRRARAVLDGALERLGATVGSRADFDRQVAASRAALDDVAGARRRSLDALYAASDAARQARQEVERLERERESFARRRGNVPDGHHRARVALAQAAGLEVDDLPFVAELLELRPEHEHWREAANLALGGFALRLVVDERRLAGFRAAIDQVPSAVRLRYEGVPVDLAEDVARDERTLPGRLDVKPGPFAGWLAGRLATAYDYVCVDDPAELGRHAKALTRTGQTSDGARGAHGGHGRENVLGFTNSRRLADLDARLESAREAERRAAEVRAGAELRDAALAEQTAAHERVVELVWEHVDVAAAQAELERWEAVLADLQDGDTDVRELRDRVAVQARAVDELHSQVVRARDAQAALDARWEEVTEAVDVAQAALDAAEARGTALAAAHRAYLDDLLARAAGGDAAGEHGAGERGAGGDAAGDLTLPAFDAALHAVGQRLVFDREQATAAVTAGLDALRTVFETFTRQWPDPNLGTDPDASYPDFERVLTALETERLHELEAQWSRNLARMSGDDLTALDAAISRALREISERIDPVNEILGHLPFADDDHRLRIDPRPVQSAVIARFRRDLRDVRGSLGPDATDAEREARFARMERVIDRIRRTSPDFTDLVDVRRHVRISAEKVDLAGNHVALYDHIGEKSGGESQELVAFIVGAALRYQLGDAGARRPRYAPVFLDEALIKADAQFSGRAVRAWRGLGFQLVIGAPLDKVSALEPHVDAEYVVVKDEQGRSRAVAVVGLADDVA